MKDPRIEAAANVIANRDYPYYEPDIAFATEVIAAIDNASTIATVEELDKLPIGSRVAGQKDIFERVQTTGNQWLNVSGDYFNGYSGIIPARVIHWGRA